MTKHHMIVTAAASALLACCAVGQSETPAQTPSEPSAQMPSQDVSSEIAALRSRLDQLEAQQKATELQRREAESKLADKISADELAHDAATSDQKLLTPEGFTAGYTDNRFVIQSADGNFVLRPWVHFQFREVVNDRTDFLVLNKKKKTFDDEVNQGFELRRVRFGLDGNLFTPDFTYFFNWATVRNSGNSTVNGATASTAGGKVTTSNNLGGVPLLEEAWVKYHIPTTPFYLKGGQIKDPILHDQIVSSRYQQSAERSMTADIFANGDAFTEGATFIYDPKSFVRTEAGVNHGIRSANTNFYDYPNNSTYNAYDYGFAGRVEYKVMGRWEDYAQVGAVGNKAPLLVFGVGGDYSERGRDGQLVAAADGMYADPSGLNFYGAFVDRYTTHNFGIYTQSPTGANIGTPDPKVAGKPTNEYSCLIEAGYIINDRIEPFGRYEYMFLQGTAAGSRNYVQCITGGVNYYFYGHRLKATAEAIWLPDGLPIDDGPSDVLTNSNGKTEISFVAQLQLLL